MCFVGGPTLFGAVGASEGVGVSRELVGEGDGLGDFAETVGAVFARGFKVCVESCYDGEFLFKRTVKSLSRLRDRIASHTV